MAQLNGESLRDHSMDQLHKAAEAWVAVDSVAEDSLHGTVLTLGGEDDGAYAHVIGEIPAAQWSPGTSDSIHAVARAAVRQLRESGGRQVDLQQ